MSTKLRGDIAEQAICLEALRLGWDVLQPIGDRLAYDVAFYIDSRFIRVQAKWAYEQNGAHKIETRKCKTNRRTTRHDHYTPNDFDFAIAYIEERRDFYIMPVDFFVSYAGEITLSSLGTQRKPKAAEYKNAWHLIHAG